MNTVLLISEETLKKYTLINDNIDGKYLLPTIQTTQDVDLDTILGTVLTKKLQNLVETNTINLPENSNYKELLDKYVQPYMCWKCMANIQVSVNYKLTNSGVIENQDDKKTRLSYSDSKALQSQYDRYASSYALKLENYLIKNSNIFPEYKQSENYQFAENARLCDFYLEDINTYNKRNYKYK